MTGWLCAPSGAGLADAIRESRLGRADLTRADATLGTCDWDRIVGRLAGLYESGNVELPVATGGRWSHAEAPNRMTATDASPEIVDGGGVDGDVGVAAQPRSPAISVVVCTYRRAEKLPACLDALARQTIRDRVEVIVVDDGPDDGDRGRRGPVRRAPRPSP